MRTLTFIAALGALLGVAVAQDAPISPPPTPEDAAAGLPLGASSTVEVESTGGLEPDFEEEDTGQPTLDSPLAWPWPSLANFDATTRVLSLTWRHVDGVSKEKVPFDEVIRFERARPYEQWPDELFVLLADGRRVVLARGSDVATQSLVVPAMLSLPVKELLPGQGHFEGEVPTVAPNPTLSYGSGAGGFAITAIPTQSIDTTPHKIATPTVAAGDTDEDDPDFAGEGGGELHRDEIDSVIKERMAVYQRCYQRQLQRNTGLSGTVVVRFTIGPDGKVTLAKVRKSTIGNAAVEDCMVRQIIATRFPAPRGSGSVVVSYPFHFFSG